MKRYIPFLISTLLATSCIGANKLQEEFIEETVTESLVIEGKTVFSFDRNNCQESYSPDKMEYRVGDDTMSNYYVLHADRPIGGDGSTLKGELVWTTDVDVRQKTGMEFKVVKSRGELYWLWCRKARTGLVVRVVK